MADFSNSGNFPGAKFFQADTIIVEASSDESDAQLLDRLPLDHLPDHGDLPPGSRIGWGRNARFVGREAELRQIAATLKRGCTAAIGQAASIAGLGGVGKTQLAVEAVYRYGQFFAGGVFWLACEHADQVATELVQCGLGLNLHPDFPKLPQPEQVRLVTNFWQDGRPRLLVFDNCEDPDIYRRWLPKAGKCRVLLTSRRTDWDSGVAPIKLNTLPRHESIRLLQDFRPDLADADLDPIAAELGDLPLALHLAGSYLKRCRAIAAGRADRYLDALRRTNPLDHDSLAGDAATPTAHIGHVGRTFALGFDQLDTDVPADALARAALIHAGFLAPAEPIPPWLLGLILNLNVGKEPDELALADALARLSDLGLIELDDDGRPQLHRLVAAFAMARANPDGAERERVEGVLLMAARGQNEIRLPLLDWLPHLRLVAERADAGNGEMAAALLSELGLHLLHLADHTGALDCQKRALSLAEAHWGADAPEIAGFANNIGLGLQKLNDWDGAEAAFRRALALGQADLGSDHPKIAIGYGNLSDVLMDKGDFSAARVAIDEAIRIGKLTGSKFLGNHYSKLGVILREQGAMTGAEATFRRALALDEGAWGPTHPEVGRRNFILGEHLARTGRAGEGIPLLERAAAILEATLGAAHPHTQIAQQHLADARALAGNDEPGSTPDA
ncbi:MAG: tetratricopeptide repeat protein [Alphaproteobacteria bacterium]|nr:tetratricopeptide repeat protein [Alphaproteobacteria bacterium]